MSRHALTIITLHSRLWVIDQCCTWQSRPDDAVEFTISWQAAVPLQ
jgi:hypothetical protein